MFELFDSFASAIFLALLYELGSRCVMGDERKAGEYQGPPPSDEELVDGFLSAFGPMIDHLPDNDRDLAVGILIAGYRADPYLAIDVLIADYRTDPR